MRLKSLYLGSLLHEDVKTVAYFKNLVTLVSSALSRNILAHFNSFSYQWAC